MLTHCRRSQESHYAALVFGSAIIYLIQHTFFDSQPTHVSEHALRNSVKQGATFVSVQVLLASSLLAVGVGIKIVAQHAVEDAYLPEMVLLSSAIALSVLFTYVVRLTHNRGFISTLGGSFNDSWVVWSGRLLIVSLVAVGVPLAVHADWFSTIGAMACLAILCGVLVVWDVTTRLDEDEESKRRHAAEEAEHHAKIQALHGHSHSAPAVAAAAAGQGSHVQPADTTSTLVHVPPAPKHGASGGVGQEESRHAIPHAHSDEEANDIVASASGDEDVSEGDGDDDGDDGADDSSGSPSAFSADDEAAGMSGGESESTAGASAYEGLSVDELLERMGHHQREIAMIRVRMVGNAHVFNCGLTRRACRRCCHTLSLQVSPIATCKAITQVAMATTTA